MEYSWVNAEQKIIAIPAIDLPKDVRQSNDYIRQYYIFSKICENTLYKAKSSWSFHRINIKKDSVVLLADTKLLYWTERKLYARFLFIHEDVVHQMEVPVVNWNVWFETVSPEDEESS